ncbi:unnamed protein product [uncultured bacterium]|nr:unnamed protein product [uncultured bacterium]
MQPDIRSTIGAELRAMTTPDGTPTIVGYAAIFNSPSEDLGGFREVIRPGAFAAALAGADVRALINHDRNQVLGRTKAGTLLLHEDSRGLRFQINPPDTQFARDLQTSIGRGDVSGASFRFYMFDDPARGQQWRSEPSGVVRELTEIAAIDDVSVAAYPAYLATEVSIRSLEEYRRSQPRRDEAWIVRAWMKLRLEEAVI